MMISQIYDKYKIMPQLQLHMLRVAGVASLICDNFKEDIDKEIIVSACLLHDMGNIIKFDLYRFPEFTKEKGVNYWEDIKKEYITKYGDDEHLATYNICQELGLTSKITNIIKAYGFSKGEETYKQNSMNLKIAAYSDHRVAPFGIVSLEERINESKKRYKDKPQYKNKFIRMPYFWRKIQKQIFDKCSLEPESINDEFVRPIIADLKNFEITTN